MPRKPTQPQPHSDRPGSRRLSLRRLFFCLSLLAAASALTAYLWPIDRDGPLIEIGTEDGDSGLINMDGRVVIEPIWREIIYTDKAHTRQFSVIMVQSLVNKREKWGAINRSGDVIVPTEKDEITWSEEWQVFTFEEDDKCGLLNREGETIIPPTWDGVWPFDSEGMAKVMANEKYGWINTRGEVVVPAKWSSGMEFDEMGMAAVSLDGETYGWIDRRGEILIEPVWERPKNYSDYRFDPNGLAAVVVDGKIGWINRQGELTISPEWDLALPAESGALIPVARADDDGTRVEAPRPAWGFIDTQGKVSIEPKWDFALPFDSSGMARVKMNAKWGAIDTSGKVLIAPEWDTLKVFDDHDMAIAEKSGLYGWINRSGETIIPIEYKNVYHFDDNGLALVTKIRFDESEDDGGSKAYHASNGLSTFGDFIDRNGHVVMKLPEGGGWRWRGTTKSAALSERPGGLGTQYLRTSYQMINSWGKTLYLRIKKWATEDKYPVPIFELNRMPLTKRAKSSGTADGFASSTGAGS